MKKDVIRRGLQLNKYGIRWCFVRQHTCLCKFGWI